MSEHAVHVTCAEFVRLVSDYIERALTSAETSLVEEHINYCDGCGRYLDQMAQTIHLAGLLRTEQVAPELSEALVESFRSWRAP
jgi:predicted anti-sigma-YlaC factor YlaD